MGQCLDIASRYLCFLLQINLQKARVYLTGTVHWRFFVIFFSSLNDFPVINLSVCGPYVWGVFLIRTEWFNVLLQPGKEPPTEGTPAQCQFQQWDVSSYNYLILISVTEAMLYPEHLRLQGLTYLLVVLNAEVGIEGCRVIYHWFLIDASQINCQIWNLRIRLQCYGKSFLTSQIPSRVIQVPRAHPHMSTAQPLRILFNHRALNPNARWSESRN